ncbi:MAG TPA: hypothetical protein EYP33_05945, partial [Pyrodictium sp.]|nr:hypothetical protein [Pyrodictium sp.]
MVGEFELSGYDSRVATGRVLAFFEGASSVISGLPTQPDALVQVSREASEVFGDLAGAVVANAYYEDPGGALLPAATQVVEQEGLVIYKTLMYAATPASGEGYVIPVMAYNGLTQSINYYGFSVAPDNSNLVAFSFPATKFRLVVLYTIQEEDAATGEIIRFYCYAYEQIIDLGPREVIDLGNINLRLVEAGSLEECMSELNVKPAGDGFSAFHPILVLDAASTPSQFNYKEDAMIALIPTG